MSELSLIVSLSVSKSCIVSCTKETVLGLQQVDVFSRLQNSEQAIWADEQLHICEERGLSLLLLLLIMTLGDMHLVVLPMSNQTQVDPALVDTVAMQLSKYKLENEPALVSLISKCLP